MLSPMSSLTTASSSSLSLSLLAISSLFLQLPISTHAHSSSPSCKAVPGTHDWPSEHSWKRLNESTGGRLLRPPPPGAVCHPGQPTYDAAKCPAVQSGWGTYQFHSDDPISSMWNQYNNDSCIPDPSDPCSGEGYPLFVINATTAEHVKLGVDFARENNIRLIVKSSGHDYIGRAVAPNSLSIWVHYLKGMKAHNSFKPDCCDVKIDGPALTVGGGEQMFDIYTYLDTLNQTAVGGGGKTVSVGGYMSGGGHSLLSARFGLATDQILEIEAVTPQGEIVTANECKNKDLFWALRGGGGSTFGIMTSITFKTHPTPPLVGIVLIVVSRVGDPSVFPAVSYLVSQFPDLGDKGLSGYSYLLSDFPNPYDGGNTSVAGFFGSFVIQDTQDPADMSKLWAPVLKHVNKTWPDLMIVPNVTTYTSFLDWYSVNYDKADAGYDQYVGSRLLDRDVLTSNLTANAEAFKQFASGGSATAYLVSGKGVHNAKPRGGSNAILPAWRKAYVHATVGVTFEPLNATAKREAQDKMNHLLDPLRKLAPDSGAYMNEAAPFEPDWQHQFWGDNYERLVEIKRKVDPHDVLWCNPCVGNERWEEVGNKLCRV